MSPDGTLAYVMNSMAWSFVGAAIVVIYQRLRDRRSMERQTERNWSRPNWVQVIAVIVLVIAVANAILGWQTDHRQRVSDERQREFVACQANVNQLRTEALTRLSTLANEDRAIVDRMVKTVVESTSQDQVGAALVQYLAERNETEVKRQIEGPLPQPAVCGRPPT